MESKKRAAQSYGQRAAQTSNTLTKQLFTLMEQKKTNLCLADDETDAEKFLELIRTIGPEICLLKTHIDIIEKFTPLITAELSGLAKQHNFLIFEDRKFADIGHTVTMQYRQGIYKIADWSHLTNAHAVPGPGVIEGLRTAAGEQSKPRGLLLLAQMSSRGNLATDSYTKQTIRLAEQYQDFVVGFIGNGGSIDELKKLVALAKPQFIIATPGVKLGGGGDRLKQQYTTPTEVISAGSDIIIVGRGIYDADNPSTAAKKYRQLGWNAYRKRIKE